MEPSPHRIYIVAVVAVNWRGFGPVLPDRLPVLMYREWVMIAVPVFPPPVIQATEDLLNRRWDQVFGEVGLR